MFQKNLYSEVISEFCFFRHSLPIYFTRCVKIILKIVPSYYTERNAKITPQNSR